MMEEELDKIEEAMVKILGVKPKLYMPPYGEIHVENTNVTEGLEVLQKRGYTSSCLFFSLLSSFWRLHTH